MYKNNRYILSYVNGIVRSFRLLNNDVVIFHLNGVKKLFESDSMCLEFIELLQSYDFFVSTEGELEHVSTIEVTYSSGKLESSFSYHLDNLPHLIELSSKTNLSLYTLVVMKIISIYISKTKTLFKAFALDLDDTIWNGTLSEDGLQTIKENLCSDAGKPFVNFMNFVSSIAKELGIFVTICSRNDASLVKEAIEQLDEDIFPLKHQIDYIVANNNDKSSNLIKVAEQLSILPNSIIFIDDNAIIRDEVRSKIPDMLVPDWDDHQDLILQIISGGYFDRPELSMSAQNRRKQYKIIHEERQKNSLPSLKIRVREDINHVESRKLYAKSNQFKTTDRYYNYDESCKSLVFELFRETGDCLGLCSAITFRLFNNECVIVNWAISCRYFEIGLEEFVLLYMREHYNFSDMYMILQKTGKNKKVEELIDKYYGSIICDDCSSVPNDSEEFVKYLPNTPTYNFLRLLNKKIGSFQLYFVSGDFEVLDKNTNLKLVNND